MTAVIAQTARPGGFNRPGYAVRIWMSALLVGLAAPATAQRRPAQPRPVDIAVTNLGLPGTFQVLINDRGLVVGRDSAADVTFVLDTRTGAYDGSLPFFEPFDINRRGEVVGVYDAPRSSGGTQGAFWTAEEGRRLSSTFLARGINKHGDMAGNCITGIDQIGPPCVFITGQHKDGSGVMHAIDVPADSGAMVAINDHGVAVGNAFYADGSVRAFRWSVTDGLTFLEAPASKPTYAAAINNHGLIAGRTESDNVAHPAMWIAGSGAIAAQLTSVNGYASAINDQGVLLVTSVDAQTGHFAYGVWIPGRHIFAALPPADPAAAGVVASDINNRGEIIGSQYYVAADGSMVTSMDLIMWQVAIRGAHH